MKLHRLFLILTFMVFSTNSFAQNNDMKARMEFEDAETAYQSQDYRKTVTHLESAERLLGKPTAKTRYLLILSLNEILPASKNLPNSYKYEDLEKLRNLTKHYVDNYTTDTEKYRDIYDLYNHLNRNYPKTLAEYNQIQQADDEKREQKIKQEKEKLKQEAEELKQAQAYVTTLAQKYGGFVSDITVDEFANTSQEHHAYLKGKKGDWKYDEKRVGLVGIRYDKDNGSVAYYGYLESYFKPRTPDEQTQEAFKKLAKEILTNIPKEYYKIYHNKNFIDIEHFLIDNEYWSHDPIIVIKVPGLDLQGIIIQYSSHSKGTFFYIRFFSKKYDESYYKSNYYGAEYHYELLNKN